MDPNDLLSLLGYSGAPAPQVPADPATSPVVSPEQLTDAGNPNQAIGAVTSPEQTMADQPPQPVTPSPASYVPGRASSAHDVSTRTSDSGFSTDKFAQVQRATSGLDGKIASDRSARQQEWAPAQAAYGEVNREALHAASVAHEAAAAKAEIEAHGNLQMQDANRRAMAEDQAAMAQAQAQSVEGRARYEQALASIPQVNPRQLWEHAGNAGQYGMVVSAFMHDFLGAKGIKTSAMDTINRAVDRNIEAQIQNINTKKTVASGFKDLWEMTQRESATQSEARAKMQGYMLASVKSGIQAEMGKYDSRLADATYMESIAKIDEGILNKKIEVGKHIDDAAHQDAQLRVTRNGQELAASTAKADRESRERVARMEADARVAAAKGPKVVKERQIIDPQTNRGLWTFKDGVRPEQQDKVLETVAKYEPANHIMNRLRELERKLSPVPDPVTGTRFTNQDQREYDGLRTELAHALVAARGERPTDKDVDEQLKLLPTNTMLTNGGISRILAEEQINLNAAMKASIRQFTNDTPAEDQEVGPVGDINAGDLTDAHIVHKGEDVHLASPVDLHNQALGSGDKWKVDASTDAPTAAWKAYVKKEGFDPLDDKRRGAALMGTKEADPDVPPIAFSEMYHLGELAMAGDQQAKASLGYYEHSSDIELRKLAEFVDSLPAAKKEAEDDRNEVNFRMRQRYGGAAGDTYGIPEAAYIQERANYEAEKRAKAGK